MDLKNILLTVFMISILLLAGMFVGSMIGQVVKGEVDYLNDIEVSIIMAALILCIEMMIVAWNLRKKKETHTSEYVKEARKITY